MVQHEFELKMPPTDTDTDRYIIYYIKERWTIVHEGNCGTGVEEQLRVGPAYADGHGAPVHVAHEQRLVVRRRHHVAVDRHTVRGGDCDCPT